MPPASLTNKNASQADHECERVSPQRLLVLAVTFGEDVQIGEETVLAKGLEDFGCRNETGKSRTKRGSEATGVVERIKSRDQGHHLIAVV